MPVSVCDFAVKNAAAVSSNDVPLFVFHCCTSIFKNFHRATAGRRGSLPLSCCPACPSNARDCAAIRCPLRSELAGCSTHRRAAKVQRFHSSAAAQRFEPSSWRGGGPGGRRRSCTGGRAWLPGLRLRAARKSPAKRRDQTRRAGPALPAAARPTHPGPAGSCDSRSGVEARALLRRMRPLPELRRGRRACWYRAGRSRCLRGAAYFSIEAERRKAVSNGSQSAARRSGFRDISRAASAR